MQIKPIIIMLAALWPPLLHAADAVPPHLVGSWGTAESLHAGTTGQSELHLDVDGLGIMAGSTAPAVRADGKDDGKPGPRAIIGFPVRAAWDGDALTVRPDYPGKDGAKLDPRLAFLCRHAPAEPTLTCTGPDGIARVMKRRSETLQADSAKAIEDFRRQAAAKQ